MTIAKPKISSSESEKEGLFAPSLAKGRIFILGNEDLLK